MMTLKQKNFNHDCDSQNALHLIANQVMNNRAKQIEIRFYFTRYVVFDKKN